MNIVRGKHQVPCVFNYLNSTVQVHDLLSIIRLYHRVTICIADGEPFVPINLKFFVRDLVEILGVLVDKFGYHRGFCRQMSTS